MGIRLMGVYRGDKRVGYEIFFGMEARNFPPREDLVNLHRNILFVKDRKDGFLLFLNVNLPTLIEEEDRLRELFRESEDIPFIAVLELTLEEIKEAFSKDAGELERVLNTARYEFPAPISFSGVSLTFEDYDLVRRFSPDYVKVSIKELSCLSPEAIETFVVMFEENTKSAVVFTHVESEEEFKKVPEEALWLGYYEEKLLKLNRSRL
ncbi:hypothetical protein [Hydrogenivirga sp. 128-5-R1-1]|uniref:hypothetical protein n=1 Tax=Hydrogenivirga sp. 128-5-R1-1 TaxID=392423 RepID=UPI0002FF4C66|nr:hypothetical protein [Hydrogenivirga sp. 128-5-R1-1]